MVSMANLLQRYLLFWLVLSSILAAIWPSLGISIDPFVASKPALSWIVAVTMFCVGALLPIDEVRAMGKRWSLILAGTAVQYGSMPFLAWGMATALHLPHDYKVGLIMVGCVPGAMASNVLTMMARGNVSYSVGLTTSATLLSPIVVPIVLKLTLGTTADATLLLGTARSLCLQVVIPVVCGFALSRVSVSFQKFADTVGGSVANLAILWIIAVVVGLNRERMNNVPAMLLMALVLLNLGGYLSGYLGARLFRLPVGMRRALMLEVGMQNAGVGAGLATTLFVDKPEISLPCALFAFGCMLTGTVLAQWFAAQPNDDRDTANADKVPMAVATLKNNEALPPDHE